LPAITHIDFSARVQTVHKETNERYWQLIKAFEEQTGWGVLVNTSFNVRGEPIVCTPEDAYRCFMRTEMDYLVMGDVLFKKEEQPQWEEEKDWREEYELD
jgi:carbamoyltransferase